MKKHSEADYPPCFYGSIIEHIVNTSKSTILPKN